MHDYDTSYIKNCKPHSQQQTILNPQEAVMIDNDKNYSKLSFEMSHQMENNQK